MSGKARNKANARAKLSKEIAQALKKAGIDADVNANTGDVLISFGKDYIKTASEMAVTHKLGARALKSIVEGSVFNLMYRSNQFRNSGVTGIEMNKYPTAEYQPVLVYDDDTKEVDTKFKLYGQINDTKTD